MEIAFIVCVVLFCFISILYLIQSFKLKKLRNAIHGINEYLKYDSFNPPFFKTNIYKTIVEEDYRLLKKIRLIYKYLGVEEKESELTLQKKTKVNEETKTKTV